MDPLGNLASLQEDIGPSSAYDYSPGFRGHWVNKDPLGCPGQEVNGLMVIGSMGYNILLSGIYWGYNPLTY